MKKTIIAGGLAAASMAVLIGGAALAQTTAAAAAHHTGPEARRAQPLSQAEFVQARVSRLTALDGNHDGTVTVEEMRAGAQARRAEQASMRFDRLDADKNGQISRAEFDAARSEHSDRAGHRGPRGGEHRGQRMAHRGGREEGHGPAQRVARHGPVVISEVQTKLTARFARLDADRDGVLSAAERQAGRADWRARVQERRGERQSRTPTTSASPSAPASE